MFLIADGTVEVTCRGPNGLSVMVHVARSGEILGEAEALGGTSCAATATALAGSVVLFCPLPLLREQTRSETFLRNIARVFCERLVRDNTSKFIDQFYPVERRLCAYLYRLSVHDTQIAKTQTELAGFLGCARQTLNRELGRLRDIGVITLGKGKIRVTDRSALLARATSETPPD
jgi:CRP-like cAMP-binding protein